MKYKQLNIFLLLFYIIPYGLYAIVPYSRPYVYQHSTPYRRTYMPNDPSVWMSKLPVHNNLEVNQPVEPFTQNSPHRFSTNPNQPSPMRALDPETYYRDWLHLLSGHKSQRCYHIPSNMSLCNQVGYNRMILPNYLHHEDMKESIEQSQIWLSLVHTECHPDLRKFLCALYAPVCVDGGQMDLILPCSEMCDDVRHKCLPKMLQFGFDWPDIVKCSRFPLSASKMCIPSTTNTKPQCSGCLENPTYESVISSFCMADISLRVRISHVVATNSSTGHSYHIRIDPKFKQFKLNIPQYAMVRLHFEVQCGCDVLHRSLIGNRFRMGKWIIMGKLSTDGRSVHVEHLSRLKRGARELKSAIKSMRKSPVSVCRISFKNKTAQTEMVEENLQNDIENKNRDELHQSEDFQSDSGIQTEKQNTYLRKRENNVPWMGSKQTLPIIPSYPIRRASLRSSSRKSLVRRSQNNPFKQPVRTALQPFGRKNRFTSSWLPRSMNPSPLTNTMILPNHPTSFNKHYDILEADQDLFAPHTLQPWF